MCISEIFKPSSESFMTSWTEIWPVERTRPVTKQCDPSIRISVIMLVRNHLDSPLGIHDHCNDSLPLSLRDVKTICLVSVYVTVVAACRHWDVLQIESLNFNSQTNGCKNIGRTKLVCFGLDDIQMKTLGRILGGIRQLWVYSKIFGTRYNCHMWQTSLKRSHDAYHASRIKFRHVHCACAVAYSTLCPQHTISLLQGYRSYRQLNEAKFKMVR